MMTFNSPVSVKGVSNNNELSSLFSSMQVDHVAGNVLSILDQYAITLDTQNYPANLYAESLLYMIYWFHRLRDPARKLGIQESISHYLNVDSQAVVISALLSNQALKGEAKQRIEDGVMIRKTVDVLVIRDGEHGRQILTLDRSTFPLGMALPGGLMRDDDEQNELGIPGNLFAALRVTGSKVLGAGSAEYGIGEVEERKYYFVRSEAGKEARIYMDRTISYAYRDHLREIAGPSDPRHIVDTIGFLVEIVNPEGVEGRWLPESVITTPNAKEGSFAFGHHKQIAAALIAKNFTKTQGISHHEWIRAWANNPVDMYEEIRARFRKNGDSLDTPILELLPVVEYFRGQMTIPAIEEKCQKNPALSSMRDQISHKLHHITIQNGAMCPYVPTVRILFEAVGFFDVACRTEKDLSTHFQKKYWYRYEELMRRIPDVIVIPTFDNISATDLMKIRGTPVYFIGVSTEPVYVDEFWQSPLEFLIHDLNHAWKMMDMDDRFLRAHPNVSRDELMKSSNQFIREYFPRIAIQKTDTEQQKEMKKLKKILLFEVGHEDARPLLANIVCEALLEDEGYEFPDNVIRYDEEGKQAYLEKRTIPGITALSYVRHKLQHGFFDQTDSQNIQIVSPKYRTVEWIVQATEEILGEMNASIPPAVQTEGLTQYLTRQACSRGPMILHAPENIDPAVDLYGDGTHVMK
ncbi:hypothetical protein [Undibacterium macrobrachii]|jgi:hypothetical protein|uniref:Nudix hydrolase domain-containing protein n=1 Tax=Undibacterium macrobrachii TaxID=1119058 RepID=A0ABQ2XL54_9BURK|nr:hypothetical protein [Undibacterium macrobrachii]GGX22455.1 hypothetical protein GCM10011282_30610 [Undibacterium macrobrachii]